MKGFLYFFDPYTEITLKKTINLNTIQRYHNIFSSVTLWSCQACLENRENGRKIGRYRIHSRNHSFLTALASHNFSTTIEAESVVTIDS